MQKLLIATLLLAGSTLQPASAQKAVTVPKTPQRKAIASTPDYDSPTWVPDGVTAEFCKAYNRYFMELPTVYRHDASLALQDTPLADPTVNLTDILAQDVVLREAVYQTIYQCCYTVKYKYNSSRKVDEVVYIMLYNYLHLNSSAATQLTTHIASRYKQPAPLVQVNYNPLWETLADNRHKEQAQHSTTPAPLQSQETATVEAVSAPSSKPGLEMSGWRYDTPPTVEALDGQQGFIRFKIEISSAGEVESVTKVAGNVSAAQEKLCRDKLLDARCIKNNAEAGAATGFYTFRFTVR